MPESYSAILSELVFANAEERDWQGGVGGTLPSWAEGTLYLNGPGAFVRGGLTRQHWLDGDGLVRRLRFEGERAELHSRYVGTPRFQEEQATGTALFRSFGTAFPGDRLRRGLALYSCANVSVHPIAGRLLAFGEQSLPWRMDPATLETLGECTFRDRLTGIAPVSAHPKLDPRNGHICNFGTVFLFAGCRVTYLELDASLELRVLAETELPTSNLVHDCLISEHHAVLHLSDYRLDVMGFAKQGQSLLEAMHWTPGQESSLLVLSRETGTAVGRVPTGSTGFCLHAVNAFEHYGMLTVDLLEVDTPYFDRYFAGSGLLDGVGPTRLRRMTVDTRQWTLAGAETVDTGLHLDFPCVDRRQVGRHYRHAWLLGMPVERPGVPGFYDRLVRLDWQQAAAADCYQAPPGWFLAAEPQLIARPQRDDEGLLLCQGLDLERRRSSYLFFDAFDLARGPVARIDLPFFDPPALHSAFQAGWASP